MIRGFALFLGILCAFSCSPGEPVLRLAVTTSLRDSGVIDELVPAFEARGVRVDVVAVGTGQALKLGTAGDVDVVFCHDREAELRFLAAGDARRHEPVMESNFILVGPPDGPIEPSAFATLDAARALALIARSNARFLSRGDESGTHRRELALWHAAGGRVDWPGYAETGRGMGATLVMADQQGGYTLCDRPTYLQFTKKVALVPVVDQGNDLANPYGVLAVVLREDLGGRPDYANEFCDYLVSAEVQARIAAYTIEGQKPFRPAR